MPMIDVYAPAGTFRDRAKLARDLATAVMTIERVPNIPLFRQNTAAFVHELPPDSLSNVDGDSACVRVQDLGASYGGAGRWMGSRGPGAHQCGTRRAGARATR
jgi:hypothetical protein